MKRMLYILLLSIASVTAGCHDEVVATLASKAEVSSADCKSFQVVLIATNGKFYIAHNVPVALYSLLEPGDEVTIRVLRAGDCSNANIIGRHIHKD